MSAQHREAMAHLVYAVESRAGFIELTGEVGTGKTTLLRTFLNRLDAEGHRTALIFNPCLSSLELLTSINREFGLPCQNDSRLELLQVLNGFLLEQKAAGRSVVLVMDEAQLGTDIDWCAAEVDELLTRPMTAPMLRARITLPRHPGRPRPDAAVRAHSDVRAVVGASTIVKLIIIHGKIINIVVR